MKRTTILRKTGLAAAAVSLSFGLAACGEDEPTAADTPSAEDTRMDDESSDMGDDTGDDMGDDPEAQTYGAACGEVPTEGDGSFDGMATAPVASAASANPLLSTLVTAVGAADLVEPLNSAEALTVFAPANPAFEAFTKKQLNGLLKDKETLSAVLTHHVVAEKIAPDQLTGEFETLAGDTITINGSGEEATIGDEKATVLCGNIPTANATVYVVDTVLMP